MNTYKNSMFADEDLIESFIYGITTWGEEDALKYKELLEKGRNKICADPYLVGSKSQEKLSKNCRSYRVANYYYFYRFNEADKSIEIARVLHETRDFPIHVMDVHFPE